jgi:carboxymethylenebutenolidase
MKETLTAETLTIPGHNGDEIEAYLAKPGDTETFAGVVVIHHLPGYDSSTKEIVRKFAANGYAALMPNLYYRDFPDASPDDAAAAVRAKGGVADEQVVGDVGGAADYLRSLPGCNGKIGVIGYCSGGRQSFLAGCTAGVDAAVDCYGAFVSGTPPKEFPIPMTPLLYLTPQLGCPLLGLFGNEDKFPSPEHVDELEAALKENGKEYEFHRYDEAGHGFFAVDRPMYRQAAATDGWVKVFDFFGRKLAG